MGAQRGRTMQFAPAGARQAGERREEAGFELGGVKIKRFARLITALSRRRLGSRHGYARCDLGAALPRKQPRTKERRRKAESEDLFVLLCVRPVDDKTLQKCL